MQKDPLIAAMVGALLLGSIAVLALGVRYELLSRQNRRLQAQFMAVQNSRAQVQALVNETLEYSKRNPAINPILQHAGVLPAAK